MDSLLRVHDLHVDFQRQGARVEAVRGVSFELGRERLAVVGESGSGKSVTFRALLGLLPARQAQVRGSVQLGGQPENLLQLPAARLTRIRGREIGMIIQDPRQGLNPMRTVASQLDEMLRLHTRLDAGQRRQRARELLDDVEIRDPERVLRLYPHEVSGGMGQRIMIAMMLAGEPRILIADEATSALDSVSRNTIMGLLQAQVRKRDMGLVLISHDLDLVAAQADRVLVMYAGRIVESLDAARLDQAQHPYTRGLLACRPSLARAGQRLEVLRREAAWSL
ncbi:MAG: Oligopeptide transport ATP-binding protein OppD [Stenotrophomonas maltophilia]|nr:MAG: Oligopeptide transport ATP-binding protein OppD [Stenotrophomonas maltophilia]